MYKKLLFIFALFLFSIPTVLAEDIFTDVDQYNRYYDAVKYLKDKGVIEGYEDGTFRPNQKINRAEALKVLLLGSQKEITSTKEILFTDTDQSAWYIPYIREGLQRGIVQGYPDNTFKPEQTINKVESIKMVLKTNDITPPTVSLTDQALFTDTPISKDSLWYQPYIFYAAEKNILEPASIYTFAPANSMTRGEIADMMYRLSTIQEKSLERFQYTQTGIASFYGTAFDGKNTASGEAFSNTSFSAAHRFFPFNTFVKVKNSSTGISMFVKINDRGPYVEGRVLDLSQIAMQTIEQLSSGIVNVRIMPIGVIPNMSKTFIKKDTFVTSETTPLGVQLDNDIQNILFPREIVLLKGSTINDAKTVTALIKDKTTKKEKIFQANVFNKRFSLPIYIENPGTYTLNIIPDTIGVGYGDIFVIDEKYFTLGDFLKNVVAPTDVKLSFQGEETKLSWNKNGNNVFKIHFLQGSKEKIFYITNDQIFTLPFEQFEDFHEGDTSVFIEGARISTPFSMDRYTEWKKSETLSFTAVKHEYTIYKTEKIAMSSFLPFISGNAITLNGTANTTLSPTVWYMLPSGKVEKVELGKNDVSPNSSLSITIPVSEKGTYIVEINDMYGEAVFNYPFYAPASIALIPNIRDDVDHFSSIGTLNLAQERKNMVQAINKIRSQLSLSSLLIDDSLNSLAQDRSDDMNARHYFSHVTPDGKTVNDMKEEYGITASLGENLAKDMNIVLALDGLFRSPAHRESLIFSEYKKVGIGITKTEDERVIVAQVFE